MCELPCVTCLVHRNSSTNVMLQSWTKVLGQICTLGAFAHTTDPNTTLITLLTLPPAPHSMLKTIDSSSSFTRFSTDCQKSSYFVQNTTTIILPGDTHRITRELPSRTKATHFGGQIRCFIEDTKCFS